VMVRRMAHLGGLVMSGGDGIGINVILGGGLEAALNELLVIGGRYDTDRHTIATNPVTTRGHRRESGCQS
jgi:hypothetical protein